MSQTSWPPVPTLHRSKELGITGENGEEIVLFYKDKDNLMGSGWKWFHAEADAWEWDRGYRERCLAKDQAKIRSGA